MNDTTKTIVAVAVAAVLALAAYFTKPAPVTDQQFSDQGAALFPGFTDPTAVRALQVLSYDEQRAEITPFKVEFDGTRWVIPSHHGYPADATGPMAKAASVFVGLVRDQVVSDRAADHEALGVLSPDDAAASLKGRGTRVTLTGEGGSVLTDLIIGKEAPSVAGEQGAAVPRRYVRLPDKTRVYAVAFDKTFSTSFSEWVETDLLKLEGMQVQRLLVDRYEIDEEKGMRREVERVELAKGSGVDVDLSNPAAPRPKASWTMTSRPGGPLEAGQTLRSERVEEAIAALGDLRIAGVRPKPGPLAEFFAGTRERVTQADLLDLQARGFFVTPDGTFVANEGEVRAACEDGVVYTLYFGEVLFGEGSAVSSGAGADEAAAAVGPVQLDAAKGRETRYVLVSASFDESVVPMPVAPPASPAPADPAGAEPPPAPGGAERQEGGASPDAAREPPAEAASEPAVEPAIDPAMVAYEAQVKARQERLVAGKERARRLSQRFASWYYVIDADAFKKLRPTREELVNVAAPAEGQPAEAPAMPAPAGP